MVVGVLLTLAVSACKTAEQQNEISTEPRTHATAVPSVSRAGGTQAVYDSLVAAGTMQATFAGGCFWCMEPVFDVVPGVIATISGYTGGSKPNPTYDEVSSGRTGHAEAMVVFFDPSKVDYATLLDLYWRNIDPLTRDRQFCDGGTQYRAAIFAHDAEQRRMADSSKQALIASRRFSEPIVTEIEDATTFTVAEEYHQDFYQKEPEHYAAYKQGCRRDQRLKEVWGEKK
ncbi:MAG: peptide-methionine (S)-S-oxide reductase MsrA [bacterium]|nr:peptide-methionine (S)-S-oxide reductase MsrA [Candidatus Kapabacteria bacterium]